MIRMARTTRVWWVALAVSAACGKDADGPALTSVPTASTPTRPPHETAAPPAREGSADLVFTGALEATATGQVVACGYTSTKGTKDGGTWRVETDAFTFQLMAVTNEELEHPAVILNQRTPTRTSYVWKRKAGTARGAANRTVATIDADLSAIGSTEMVHVKGTMTCPELIR